MMPELKEIFLAWSIPPWTTASLVLTAAIYLRGWAPIRRTRPEQFPGWRLFCFLCGLFSLFLATASPVDTFDDSSLSAHMVQHFLFMSAAPPLLLLAHPQVPLLRGLPRFVRRILGPLFRLRWLHRVGNFLTSLTPAWLLMNLSYIGWHVPAAYELALRSENWHNVEHACFFFTSILFWWPLVRPWPTLHANLRWMLLPYLLASDFVNTGLSAMFCFAGRLFYPSYATEPNPFGISALNDQIAAGAFMWVAGSTVFLIPASWITIRLLSPKRGRRGLVQAAAGVCGGRG
jgi:cytochrome c oxidase assembly factor CtaG